MTKIIKNRIASIYGLPGEGKTFFAAFLASGYGRIYSNFDIYKGKKKINTSIKTMLDIENIKYNDEKGVLIIDEMGANNNARKSMSDQNMQFGRLAMLSRKRNINIIFISQLERMSDVYYREMSYYNFEMKSYFSGPNYLMFTFLIKDRFSNIIGEKNIDLIKWSNITNITYNTLDTSIIH